MTYVELHNYFKLELDKTNLQGVPSFEHKEIDYWLNAAITKFVKTRYSGFNIKQQGFDQTQKRVDDLRTLIKVSKFSIPDLVKNGIFYTIDCNNSPFNANSGGDYWLTVSESVILDNIKKLPCWKNSNYEISVIDKKIHNYKQELENSLSDYNLHNGKAKPVCVWMDNKIYLFTDGNYGIKTYILTYIKKPKLINWDERRTTDSFGNIVETVYEDLPDHTHDEIIKMAVQMAIENISEPRYSTYTNEVNTME